MKHKLIKHSLSAIAAAVASVLVNAQAMAADIAGNVQCAGSPIAGSTVTLHAAGEGAPTQLAQSRTDANGAFTLNAKQAPKDSVLYLVAKGGMPKAAAGKGPKEGVALMSLLGSSWPEKVMVNELTTVASAFTAARFINGEAISGKPLSLHIAAGNTPNFVDPVTGGWGKVILDPLNSSRTTSLATLDTLGSLISAYATVANDDWRARFFKAATPTRRSSVEEHAGGNGQHCPRTVGRAQGTLCVVRRSLSTAGARWPS
jgi:hypothetical protein